MDTRIISAFDAAGYIVASFASTPDPVSNLKLQKLLYYSQGWHLGFEGVPLFREEIQAWVHGPVVPAVFFYYRNHRWSPILTPKVKPPVSPQVATHIDLIVSAYGSMTATQLEHQSHLERPWTRARKGLLPKQSSNVVISNEAMKSFFSELANEEQQEHQTAGATA